MGYNEVVSWHTFLRKTFSSLTNSDDYLLTGHTHGSKINVDKQSASVVPYSLDME